MKIESVSQESLQAAALDLLAKAENEGQIRFGEILLPAGWQLLGQEYFSAYRMKAVNPNMGLFSKIFASEASPFAAALYQAYQELATLHLQTPILKPLGLERSVLFFPLATFKNGSSLQSHLTDEQIKLASDIILEHKLVPIAPSQRVDVVKIEGKNYLVDVIEDSDATVYPFLKSRESVE